MASPYSPRRPGDGLVRLAGQSRKPSLGATVDWDHPLARGLVGAWLFQEGGGQRVSNQARPLHHGSFYSSTAQWATAPGIGFVSQHDGTTSSRRIRLGNLSDDWPQITVAVLCRAATTGNPGIPVSKGRAGNADSSTWYFDRNSSGLWQFAVPQGSSFHIASIGNYQETIWRWVVGTYDGQNVQIYVDGKAGTPIARTGPLDSDPLYPAYVGAINGSSLGNGDTSFFNGDIACVLIYDRGLAAADVRQLSLYPYGMFRSEPAGVPVQVPDPPARKLLAVPYVPGTLGRGRVLGAETSRKPGLSARIDPDHPLTRGLMGYWLMNEGAGQRVLDLSGQQHHCLYNSALWEGGRDGPALSIPGAELVPGLIRPELDFVGQPFTVLFWYRGYETGRVVGVGKGNAGGTGGRGWSVNVNLGTDFRGWHNDTAGASSNRWIAGTPNDLRWHQYVYVGIPNGENYSESLAYIDGKALGTKNLTNTKLHTAATTHPFRIAQSTSGTASGYGSFSHVAIWNRALSADEIRQLYARPYAMLLTPEPLLWPQTIPQRKILAAPCVPTALGAGRPRLASAVRKPGLGARLDRDHPLARGLKGFWIVNEGAGKVVRDYSGQGRHALIQAPAEALWVSGEHSGPALWGDGQQYAQVTNHGVAGFPFTLAGSAQYKTGHPSGGRPVISLGRSDYWGSYFVVSLASWGTYVRPDLSARHAGGTIRTILGAAGNNTYLYPWNGPHSVVGVFASATERHLYGDNKYVAASYEEVPLDPLNNVLRLMALATDSPNPWNYGPFHWAALWDRALTHAEVLLLNENPFCMFHDSTPEPWLLYAEAPAGAGPFDHTFTINEGMGVADAGSQYHRLLDLAQAVGLTDEMIREALEELVRTINDAVGMTDAQSRLSILLRTTADALGLSDSAAPLLALLRTVSDTAGLTDTVSPLLVLVRLLSDLQGLTDGTVLARTIAVAESLGATEQFASVATYLRSRSDTAALVDQVAPLLEKLHILTEALGLTDTWAKTSVFSRSQAETLGLTDSYATAWTVLRTVAESLGIVDQVSYEGVGAVVKVLQEVLGMVDARTNLHVALRALTETIQTADAASRLFAVARLVSDAQGITDGVRLARVYAFAETLGVADAVARLLDFLRVQDDAEGVLDSLLKVSAALRSIDDAAGLTDVRTQSLRGLVTSAWTFLLLRRAR